MSEPDYEAAAISKFTGFGEQVDASAPIFEAFPIHFQNNYPINQTAHYRRELDSRNILQAVQAQHQGLLMGAPPAELLQWSSGIAWPLLSASSWVFGWLVQKASGHLAG